MSSPELNSNVEKVMKALTEKYGKDVLATAGVLANLCVTASGCFSAVPKEAIAILEMATELAYISMVAASDREQARAKMYAVEQCTIELNNAAKEWAGGIDRSSEMAESIIARAMKRG